MNESSLEVKKVSKFWTQWTDVEYDIMENYFKQTIPWSHETISVTDNILERYKCGWATDETAIRESIEKNAEYVSYTPKKAEEFKNEETPDVYYQLPPKLSDEERIHLRLKNLAERRTKQKPRVRASGDDSKGKLIGQGSFKSGNSYLNSHSDSTCSQPLRYYGIL